MARYIDANILIGNLRLDQSGGKDTLRFSPHLHPVRKLEIKAHIDAISYCVEEINKIPTADVEEVKHGEWTKIDVRKNGYGQIYYQHKECPVSSTELFTCPYERCPRCGAKMDGGKAE